MWTSLPVVKKALGPINKDIPSDSIGIHGILYDISNFKHPGGNIFTMSVLGTDATALFETHHINNKKAVKFLKSIPSKGTYNQKVVIDYVKYREVRDLFQFSSSNKKRKFPLLAILCFIFAVLLQLLQCFSHYGTFFVIPTAIVSTIAGGFGHNGVHVMSPEAVLLDWNGLSAYEWLFEHIMSHHMYTNTEYDHDALSMEPFIRWLPNRAASLFESKYLEILARHFIYVIGEIVVAIQGIFIHRTRWQFANPYVPLWLKLAPFLFIIRVSILWYYKGFIETIITLSLASYIFSYLAHLNHERHLLPKTDNFFERQTSSTRDIKSIFKGALILFLDRQVKHHLFPTVDHMNF